MKTTSLAEVCRNRNLTLSRACRELLVAGGVLYRETRPPAIRRQYVPPLLLAKARWWLEHRAGKFLKGPVGKLP